MPKLNLNELLTEIAKHQHRIGSFVDYPDFSKVAPAVNQARADLHKWFAERGIDLEFEKL